MNYSANTNQEQPCSSILTPCKQGAVHFFPAQFAIKKPPEQLLQLLKPSFFRSKNFNIFYNFEPEKFSGKPLRAPTQPEKNPLSEKKNPLSEVKFSTSEVNQPFFSPKKRRETQCLGLSPPFQDKDSMFFREIQIR